ncbi:MAG: hypothetical protein ACKVP0_16385 [Pirellulaceae bacterium]
MAARSANITSIEAIRAFTTALMAFEDGAEDAAVQLEIEARRSVTWIDELAMYWPKEVRKASDAQSEARLALERCELTISGEQGRSCYDERKALEKAKRRLRLAEEKVQAVRRWKVQIRKEVEEFQVQIAKLRQYLESDLVRSIASLKRMSEALDQYVQRTVGQGGGAPASNPLPEGEGTT